MLTLNSQQKGSQFCTHGTPPRENRYKRGVGRGGSGREKGGVDAGQENGLLNFTVESLAYIYVHGGMLSGSRSFVEEMEEKGGGG